MLFSLGEIDFEDVSRIGGKIFQATKIMNNLGHGVFGCIGSGPLGSRPDVLESWKARLARKDRYLKVLNWDKIIYVWCDF